VARLDGGRREGERTGGDERLRTDDAVEHAVDVDPAMRGTVGSKPASGLLELALAARPVPATPVVPGDCDVDEPLEEVALLGGRFAPLVLELLVRLEVRPLTDQSDALLEPHRSKYPESESDTGLVEC